MKAFIYIRVSDDEQVREGFSIAAQEALIRRKCEEWKYEIVGDPYVDDGYSAKNMKRPHFQRMLNDIDIKKPHVIVFWRLDRFTRSTRDFQKVIEMLEKKSCAIKSCTENIDTTTAMGRFQLELTISLGQLERETTAERVKFVMEERHRKGLRNGAVAPFGYDLYEGELFINEKEAEVVRRIYELYEKPMSDVGIAKLLTSEGVGRKVSDKWSAFAVRSVLDNPVYCGKLRWNYRKLGGKRTGAEIVVDGKHEAIIQPDHFDRIQALRKQRFIRKEKISSDFHFTGVLKCGRCGYGMIGSTQRTKDRSPSRFYRCLGRHNYGICNMPNVREKAVTDAFLLSLKADSDQYKKLIAVKETQAVNPNPDQELIARELEQIKKRRRKWQEAFANDIITLEELKAHNDEERAKEELLRARLEAAPTFNIASSYTREEIIALLDSFRELWTTIEDDMAKKRFVQEAFQNIVINTEVESPKGGRFVDNKVLILDWNLKQ